MRAAGIEDSSYQTKFKFHIAKIAQPSNKTKILEVEKLSWGDKYTKNNKSRFQTILSGSDIHSDLCDSFYRRLFIDTAKRAQPDKIVLAGDIFEAYNLSRYDKDHRRYSVISEIKWVKAFLTELRTVCSSAEIVFVFGNHENRFLRYLTEGSSALIPVLDEIADITIPKLLGIDDNEIKVVTKDSLSLFRETDIKKEIAKNYYLAYDTVLFHHFPYAAKWGYAGVNGHHHKHLVSHHYNATRGPYEWHQLGAGHVRQASYCEGEVWQNGFTLCHVDTHKKHVQFEYIDCTGDMCVIGGQFYTRKESEIVKIFA